MGDECSYLTIRFAAGFRRIEIYRQPTNYFRMGVAAYTRNPSISEVITPTGRVPSPGSDNWRTHWERTRTSTSPPVESSEVWKLEPGRNQSRHGSGKPPGPFPIQQLRNPYRSGAA